MLAVGAALYAAFAGHAGTDAVAPLPAEFVVAEQASTGRVAGLEEQAQPVAEKPYSPLQVLPPITELQGIPAPQVTTTAESRVQTLNRAIQTTPTPAPTATPTVVPRQLTCELSSNQAYCVYTVRDGDTLSTIAEDFQLKSDHMPAWELLVASNKPDIVSADDFLQPGQKLRIPTRNGIVHTVILDETVGELAEQFDVTSAEIISVNNITDSNLIAPGQVLLIPDPKRLAAPKTEAPPDPANPSAPDAPSEPTAEPTPEPPRGFIWPVAATIRITNYFSARHPLGIDLGLSHAAGTPVLAVMPGKVTFAGGDPCCSYGYYVIVDHGDGLKTLYAHLRNIGVSVGQTVSQGQVLGPSGTTGYSTGVHLHFEVHKNGTRVNPIPYLP